MKKEIREAEKRLDQLLEEVADRVQQVTGTGKYKAVRQETRKT